MPCAMDVVEMRALEDRAKRLGPVASPSSTQPTNVREELTHAETHGPKVSVRLDRGNPSEAQRDRHTATHLHFRSCCEHCVAGKMPRLATQATQFISRRARDADFFFMNRMTGSELTTVLNFLNCESGCTFTCKGMEFCDRKRVVFRTDSEHAFSASSTAVCQGRMEETILENALKYSSVSMVARRLVEGQIRTT